MSEDYFEIADILVLDSLNKHISIYGLEGCLEAIERVYTHNLTLKNKFLELFYKKLDK